MQKDYKTQGVIRILDANINRAKEGLRVSEEIARFILNNRCVSAELKNIRHKMNAAVATLPGSFLALLASRNIRQDVGKNIYAKELKRKNISDIFFANMQRVKESIRVLEEFAKLGNKKIAVKFKKIRYEVYEAEKMAARKIAALSGH